MFVKRVLDIFLSLMLLILFFPVFLLVSVLIYLDDGFPIFFKQIRIGKDCHRFEMYKFRSMVNRPKASAGDVSTGKTLQELRAAYQTTAENDPRITRVGRFIRKTHLDELPQLINVLRGDMSIVGPRPDAPVQEADYPAKYWRKRHKIKPGITGLAQIAPHLANTIRRRIVLDTMYVKQWSLCMDMRILMKTVLKVFRANSF